MSDNRYPVHACPGLPNCWGIDHAWCLPAEPPEKQEPHRWAWKHNVQILDEDGWRNDGKDFHEPITEAEFLDRLSLCTIIYHPREAT